MRLGLTAFAVVAAAILCGGAIGAGTLTRAEAQAQQPAAEYTGDVVVKFKPAATLADVGEAIEDAGTAPVASTAGSGLVLLEPEAGQSVDGAVADLEANPDVLFAEPDVVMRAAVTPTDPYYGSYQWHLPQIGLPAAWDTTTGSASVIIAVVDTGVQSTHPDLSGKVTTGGNAGYNFVGNNTNTTDDNSHGTFVAGIIAANTNNGVGGAGVCWSCKIMPVKVLDNTGVGSSFTVAQGIDWAVSHGADVINLSLGGGAASSLQTAVDNAWNAGVVVVAATGNNADDDGLPGNDTNDDTDTDGEGPPDIDNDVDDGVLYPAAYSNAIAVGSNEQNGARSSFSNYGPEIDIMAPGGSVLGTLCSCNGNPGGYGIGSGTSFAAPHIAGVAGLLIASGVTDKDEIRTRLLTTATDMEGAGFDNNTGWGRVNAAAAIGPQYAVTWGANTLPTTLAPGVSTSVNVSFMNAGTLTWDNGEANPVRFSYHWHTDTCSAGTPVSTYGARTGLASTVAPGGAVSNLSATLTAPPSIGTYCLQYDLVREGVTWFSWQGADVQQQTVTIAMPTYGVNWGSNVLPTTLAPNTTTSHAVSFTNAGTLTWAAGGAQPVRFSYHWHSGDCSANNPATTYGLRTLLPADVPAASAVLNLDASILTPASPGTYCLQYDLVREGVTWFSWQGAAVQKQTVTIATPVYGVTWGANSLPAELPPNSSTLVDVSFSNAGSITWEQFGAQPVRFSYHWHTGTCAAGNPASVYGVRTLLPADVAAGESVSNLSATISAPAAPGTYCLRYDLVREGVTWFAWQGAPTQSQTVTVATPTYAAGWGSNTLPASLPPSSNTIHNVSFTNDGSLTWEQLGAQPVRFSYHWHDGACSAGNPVSTYGVRTLLPGDVPAGSAVNDLAVTIAAPATPGTYCLQYDLVREGVTWFSWQGAATQKQTVTVATPTYWVEWGSNTLPSTFTAGEASQHTVSFTNGGSLTWEQLGAQPVRFSYHWHAGACSSGNPVSTYGVRTQLPADVPSGATVTDLAVTIAAPPTPGTYCLQYDLVREFVTWFSWQGAQVQSQTVTVN